MKNSYTYDEIKEMRDLVIKEIIQERQHLFDYPMTADDVGAGTVEDRLRTYLQFGVVPGQMKR